MDALTTSAVPLGWTRTSVAVKEHPDRIVITEVCTRETVISIGGLLVASAASASATAPPAPPAPPALPAPATAPPAPPAPAPVPAPAPAPSPRGLPTVIFPTAPATDATSPSGATPVFSWGDQMAEAEAESHDDCSECSFERGRHIVHRPDTDGAPAVEHDELPPLPPNYAKSFVVLKGSTTNLIVSEDPLTISIPTHLSITDEQLAEMSEKTFANFTRVPPFRDSCDRVVITGPVGGSPSLRALSEQAALFVLWNHIFLESSITNRLPVVLRVNRFPMYSGEWKVNNIIVKGRKLNEVVLTVTVPTSVIGAIIGARGANKKYLEDTHHVRMRIVTDKTPATVTISSRGTIAIAETNVLAAFFCMMLQVFYICEKSGEKEMAWKIKKRPDGEKKVKEEETRTVGGGGSGGGGGGGGGSEGWRVVSRVGDGEVETKK